MNNTERFTLDATDIVDRLIAILIAIASGNSVAAVGAFVKLDLTLDNVRLLPETKRAMALYFVTRLPGTAFKVTTEVKRVLSMRPPSDEALAWYNLALNEMGLPANPITPLAEWDGSDYLLWKIGKGSPPRKGTWRMVP